MGFIFNPTIGTNYTKIFPEREVYGIIERHRSFGYGRQSFQFPVTGKTLRRQPFSRPNQLQIVVSKSVALLPAFIEPF